MTVNIKKMQNPSFVEISPQLKQMFLYRDESISKRREYSSVTDWAIVLSESEKNINKVRISSPLCGSMKAESCLVTTEHAAVDSVDNLTDKQATHQCKLVNLNVQPFNILICHTWLSLASLFVAELQKISQPPKLIFTIRIQTEI